MRTLLLLLPLFLIHPATSHAATAIPFAAPTSARIAADTTAPAPTKHRRPLYEKGHGTLGFVFGAIFLWFGYAGVCIFSRNRTQRRKALRGMLTSICIALLALPFAIKGN